MSIVEGQIELMNAFKAGQGNQFPTDRRKRPWQSLHDNDRNVAETGELGVKMKLEEMLSVRTGGYLDN
jgi:hypothetical protein